MVEQILKYFKV